MTSRNWYLFAPWFAPRSNLKMVGNSQHKKQRKCSGNFCMAPGCSNSFYNTQDRETPVRFHLLPLKRPALLQRWLAALKRKNPPMGKSTRVCSDHFVDDDYQEEHFFSELGRLATRKTKLLKRDACPSVFDFSAYNPRKSDCPTKQANCEVAVRRRERARTRTFMKEQQKHRDAAWRSTQQEVLTVVTRDHDYTEQTAMFPEEPSQDDQYIPEYELTHLRSCFGSRRFASSDREIHFHTGFVTYKLLLAFWKLVEPGEADESPVTTSLPPFDELLLFLVHLSTGASLADLSQRFGIDGASVSTILSSWTRFLYRLLGSQRLWIPPELIRVYLPPEFAAFPDTQVVLHCVQVFCQAGGGEAGPVSFRALVGLAPHGSITFVSRLFGVSVSNLDVFRRSGVAELLSADVAVMVDRGFRLESVAPCAVHRPVFFRQQARSGGTGQAHGPLRVHVGRCLARLKENQLFRRSAPLRVCGSVEELFSVSCCLVNYQKLPRRSWSHPG